MTQVALAAAALALAVLAPTEPLAAQERPAAASAGRIRRDVLLITLDTTRRDYLGCYGRTPSRTRTLDYLAERSVVFADAVTTVPVTLPAHASLFTGLYPTAHGVRYNSGFKLPAEARTLAEILRENGYATRADVAAFVLDPLFGLSQGFDRYRAPPREASRPGQPAKEGELPAATIVERVLQDIDELVPGGGPPDGVRKPFFVWAHFYDPHLPYAPKKPPQLTQEEAADPVTLQKALYEQELAELDGELGRLLRGLEQRQVLEPLVLLIAADHGESLGDAVEQAHGFFLFDPTVRVPLLLRHPALPAQVAQLPVSLIDVAPTLLTTLGIDIASERFDGLDLVPWLADPDLAKPERALHLETLYAWLNFGWAPQFGCCQGELKYLRSAKEELFDRVADPNELTNLFRPDDARAQALSRRVDDYLARATSLAQATTTLSEAEKRALEALGYATGGGGGALPTDWTALPDPYQKITAYEQMNAAISAAAQKGVEATLVALHAAVAADPASAPLHEQIGLFALTGGPKHLGEATAAFDAALKIDPRRARSWFGRAQCAQLAAELGQAEAARLRQQGGAVPPVLAEETARQSGLADASLRRALDCDPTYPDALSLLARLQQWRGDQALKRKEPAVALPLLREAAALFGRLQEALPNTTPEWADAAGKRIGLERTVKQLEARQGGGAADGGSP